MVSCIHWFPLLFTFQRLEVSFERVGGLARTWLGILLNSIAIQEASKGRGSKVDYFKRRYYVNFPYRTAHLKVSSLHLPYPQHKWNPFPFLFRYQTFFVVRNFRCQTFVVVKHFSSSKIFHCQTFFVVKHFSLSNIFRCQTFSLSNFFVVKLFRCQTFFVVKLFRCQTFSLSNFFRCQTLVVEGSMKSLVLFHISPASANLVQIISDKMCQRGSGG